MHLQCSNANPGSHMLKSKHQKFLIVHTGVSADGVLGRKPYLGIANYPTGISLLLVGI